MIGEEGAIPSWRDNIDKGKKDRVYTLQAFVKEPHRKLTAVQHLPKFASDVWDLKEVY